MDEFRTIRFRKEGEYYVAILGDMEAVAQAPTLPEAVERMWAAHRIEIGELKVEWAEPIY